MEIDEAHRQSKAQADRNLTRADLARLKGPVDPTLAAVAAVIKAGRGDRDAQEAVNAAVAAYEAEIERQKGLTPPAGPAALAAKTLEIAWIALWLGDDAAKPMSLVESAAKTQALSEEAQVRFDGWRALKAGERERALELLAPLAPNDPAAAVGLAIALEQAGQGKEAARELLALNKAQPGSMIGIWASNELTRLLGQRVPLSPQATEMERLVASIPATIDRCVDEPSMAVTARVIPEDLNPGPFAPIPLRIDLTNNTNMPLALDPSGPLRPQVFIYPTINTASPLGAQPEPFIVDLDSRLRLKPRETVSATVDMRPYPAGGLLNAAAVTGGLLKIVAYTNFVAAADGTITPGLFGVETLAPIVRLDGVRKDDGWLEQAIAMMSDNNAPSPDTALRMALVANEVQHALVTAEVSPERAQLLQTATSLLPGAFARLDPVSQAWVLSVTPLTVTHESIRSMAQKSDSRLVQLAYLLFQVADAKDPMLDAARRGEDPVVKMLGESVARAMAAGAPPGTAPPAGGRPATAPASAATAPAPPNSTAPALPATFPDRR
jgi:hypothetical protein